MTVKWSVKVLEGVVAPGIGSFRSAFIPDLRPQFPEAEHWLANHFLNSAVSGRFEDRFRQVAVGIIRRASHGFSSFHNARELTLAYLDGLEPGQARVRKYYAALDQWEICTLQVYMAFELFRWLNGGVGAFTKADGTPASRLWTIANHIKHTASCVESGQCSATDLVPLWLSDAGINSFAGVGLGYVEVAELVADVARLADELQNPAGFVARQGAAGSGPG